jgi:transposase InsO family protein
MSRKGNPYDHAMAESFMKTLKYEEVYREEYRDWAEARAFIGHFLEQVYNEKRLHSPWAIFRRWNLRNLSRRSAAQPRGGLQTFRKFWRREYEFFEAWGNLSPDEWFGEFAGTAWERLPPASSVR